MAKAIINGQEIFGNVHLGEGGGGSQEPFIGSTGTQKIALPFYSDEAVKVEFDLFQGSYENNMVILGDIWSENGVVLYAYNTLNSMRITRSIDQTFTPNKWHWSHIELDFTTGTLTVDGVEIVSAYQAHGHNQQYLFGLSGRNSCAGIKNFKVYKNDTLFLDFEPREDSVTGEGYFYDRVSGVDYRGDNPLVYGEN
jgi:hypothetical protein